VIEEYEPSKYEEKKHVQWRQVMEIDRHLRVIKYYPNRNHDGLIKRLEQIGEKTTEYYQNRDDRVVYRSIRYSFSSLIIKVWHDKESAEGPALCQGPDLYRQLDWTRVYQQDYLEVL